MLSTLAPLQNLTSHHPFFRNGLLRANVSWVLPLGTSDDSVDMNVQILCGYGGCVVVSGVLQPPVRISGQNLIYATV